MLPQKRHNIVLCHTQDRTVDYYSQAAVLEYRFRHKFQRYVWQTQHLGYLQLSTVQWLLDGIDKCKLIIGRSFKIVDISLFAMLFALCICCMQTFGDGKQVLIQHHLVEDADFNMSREDMTS